MASPLPRQRPTCSACAQLLSDGDEFCPGCDAPVRPPERRVVTVCFADLSGYTALVEDLDPEVAHDAVQPLMRRLRKICESLGALVPGVQGDGFMAVYGIPQAHEDDVRRALDAAAAMQRTVSEWPLGVAIDAAPLTLHIGIHTGAVLAAPSRESGGWSVTGDVVNVASRLCGQAQTGTVLVSAASQRLLSLDRGFGASVSFAIRGRREPVTASVWAWREAEVPNRRPLRWNSPLINRESQLQELSNLWVRRGATLVLGEAGVGKTRLVMEWARRDDALLVTIGTRAFGAAAWWEPLHEAVRSLVLTGSIEELVSLVAPATVSQLSRQRWSELLGPVGSDAAAAAEGFTELIQTLAQVGRVAVLLDDAQDAQPELVGLLTSIAGTSTQATLAVVATGRPGTSLPEPFVALAVEPLSREHSQRLISSLLDQPTADVVRSITASAGGNPFFVEECALFLTTQATQGAEQLEGLATGAVGMRTFVAARVDALEQPARQTLAALAIIRESAPIELLRQLEPAATDRVLAGLEHSGMTRPAVEVGLTPHFRHGVTREVVRAGISLLAAQQAHTRAASFYEHLLADERQLTALGGRSSHLTAAYELAVALALPESARLPHRIAAAEAAVDWAEQLHAADPAAVGSLTDNAVALAREAGPSTAELLLRLDIIHLTQAVDQGADHSTVADLHVLVEKATPLGTRWRRRAQLLQAIGLFDAGERGQARAMADRLAAEVGDDAKLRHEVLMVLGEMCETAQEGLAVFEEAAQTTQDRASRLNALQRCAMLANYFDMAECRRYLALVQELVADEEVVAQGWLHLVWGWVHLYDQRFDQAAEQALDTLASGVAGHVWQLEGHAVFIAAEALLRLGQLARSRELLGTIETRVRQRAHSKGTITLERLLALLCLREGDLVGCERALAAVSVVGADDALEEGSAADVRGQCLTERGDFAAGVGELHAAYRDAERAGNVVKAVSIGLTLLRCESARLGEVPVDLLNSILETARSAGAEHTVGMLPAWCAHAAALPSDPAFAPGDRLAEELAVAADLRALGHPTSAESALKEARGHWIGLGYSVWRARSGFWLAEVTGDEAHARTARVVLETLNSPAGLEELFREQWRTAQAGRT